MRRWLVAALVLISGVSLSASQSRDSVIDQTIATLLHVRSFGEVAISPDASRVAFAEREESNGHGRPASSIFVVPLRRRQHTCSRVCCGDCAKEHRKDGDERSRRIVDRLVARQPRDRVHLDGRGRPAAVRQFERRPQRARTDDIEARRDLRSEMVAGRATDRHADHRERLTPRWCAGGDDSAVGRCRKAGRGAADRGRRRRREIAAARHAGEHVRLRL